MRRMSTTRHPMHVALRAANAADAADAAATTTFANRTIATHGSTPSDDASYLQRILNARVYEAAIETPLQKAEGLSAYTSNNVLLKREDTQPIFSFKIRGAYNKIAHLSREQMRAGIVCCSAGNHAQGVALAARKSLFASSRIVFRSARRSSRRARLREAGDGVHALDVRLNDRPRAVVASHAVLAGSHAAVVPVPEERAGEVAVRGGRLSTRAMGSV